MRYCPPSAKGIWLCMQSYQWPAEGDTFQDYYLTNIETFCDKSTDDLHCQMDVYFSICVSDLDLMLIVIIMKIGLNKPLSGKLNDSVELPLQGCRTFAHLNVLAVLSNWRVDLSLRPGLGLFQTQQFSGGGWHQQGFGPWQWVVTWWCRTVFIAHADATVGSGTTI